MSQAQRTTEPTAACDVYSIAKIVVEMLSCVSTGMERGRLLSRTAEFLSMEKNNGALQRVPATERRELAALLERCIAEEPEDRPSLQELRDALASITF